MHIVNFKVCSASAINKWCDILNDNYNKDQAIAIIKSLPFWDDDYTTSYGSTDLKKEYRSILAAKSSATKMAWLMLFAKMMGSDDNRRLVWEALPETMRAIMRYLYVNVFISAMGMRRILGIPEPAYPVNNIRFRLNPDEDLSSHLVWMAKQSGWSSVSAYFVPASVLCAFPALAGKPVKEYTVESLPLVDGLAEASFESEIFRLLPVLANMYDTGMIDKGKSKIGVSQLTRIARMLEADEFYPAHPDKAIRLWRTTLMANAYTSMRNTRMSDKIIAPLEALKHIYNLLLNTPSTTFEFLHKLLFSRLNARLIWSVNMSHFVKNVTDILKETASQTDSYLLYEGLLSEMLHSGGGRQDLLFFSPNTISNYMVTNTFSGNEIKTVCQVEEAGQPMLHTILSLLCSLGMLSLIYDKGSDPADAPSPMPYIRALKLTPLGRFIMGLDEEYTPPASDEVKHFELDPERLIIRVVEDSPYEVMLRDFARAVGGRRYVVTDESFLSGCHDIKEVRTRMDLFRQIICADLPPNWKKFFDRMWHADTGMSTEYGYTIYSIDPASTSLIDALTTDPDLRRIVIRAEGYRVLVSSNDIPIFKKLLTRHGYLL